MRYNTVVLFLMHQSISEPIAKSIPWIDSGRTNFTHCGRTNYIIDTCFDKHGYSPSYKPRGKNQFNSQANVTSSDGSSSADSIQQGSSSSGSHGFT